MGKGKHQKVFISGVCSFVGAALAGELQGAGFEVLGCDSQPQRVRNSYDIEVVSAYSEKAVYAALGCDIIVLCILEELAGADGIIAALRSASYPGTMLPTTRVLLLSSALTWGRTKWPLHMEQEPVTSALGTSPLRTACQPAASLAFHEHDWEVRLSPYAFRRHLQLEEHILGLCGILDTAVIAAGVPYGRGEGALEDFFTQAWCARDGPVALPCNSVGVEQGANKVPVIHLSDLLHFVKSLLAPTARLMEPLKFPARYMLAVDGDRTQPTLKEFFCAISKTMGGSGSITYMEESALEEVALRDPLLLHLANTDTCFSMRGSVMETILKDSRSSFDRPGTWGSGFVAKARDVIEEFVQARGLSAIRVLVVGPPGTESTHVSRTVAELYGAEVVNLRLCVDTAIIATGRSIPSGDEVPPVPKDKNSKGKKAGAGKEKVPVVNLFRPESGELSAAQKLYNDLALPLSESGIDLEAGSSLKELSSWELHERLPSSVSSACIRAHLLRQELAEGRKSYVLESFPTNETETSLFTSGETASLTHVIYLHKAQKLLMKDKDEAYLKKLNDYWEKVRGSNMEGGVPQAVSLLGQALGLKVFAASVEEVYSLDAVGKAVKAHVTGGMVPGSAYLTGRVKSTVIPSTASVLKQDEELDAARVLDRETTEVLHTCFELVRNPLAMVANLTPADFALLEARSQRYKGYLLANVIPVLTRGIMQVIAWQSPDAIDTLAEYLIRSGTDLQKKVEVEADVQYQRGVSLLKQL